ncbi:MAG TPA: hypothetical protein DEB40_08870 [Elusimicrobia bacterium]|nr:hypothetical protein [Elusimicrobiota bacterium]HBT61840.1 hypothetical protein [Elusimicrobiota bacterium]
MAKPKTQEVGDLFVSETELTIKLLPSRKSGTQRIRWFSGGCVKNLKLAAKDISCLVGRLQGRSRVIRGLTVMTDRGAACDLERTGVPRAVTKAGFEVLR